MNPVVILAVSAICLVSFVALDLRDAGFRASWSSDRARVRRNGAFLLANFVTMLALHAATRAVVPRVPAFVDWRAGGAHVGLLAVEVAACLLVAELVNWVSHWAKHKHGWLWRFHLQHHVETRYSVNLTLHTHGVEVVCTGVAMAALLALCGFSRFAVDAFTVAYFCANLYKHCGARLSLGPLDWLVVSPAYHRLHHARASDMGGWHGNYGSVLTVFDVLFGTARFPAGAAAQDEAFRLVPGTDTPEPFGFVDEMLAPLRSTRSTRGVNPAAALRAADRPAE